MTTTLIAIYGQDVNRWVKRRLAGRHLLFRTAVFVFICAFGYGWCILKSRTEVRLASSAAAHAWSTGRALVDLCGLGCDR